MPINYLVYDTLEATESVPERTAFLFDGSHPWGIDLEQSHPVRHLHPPPHPPQVLCIPGGSCSPSGSACTPSGSSTRPRKARPRPWAPLNPGDRLRLAGSPGPLRLLAPSLLAPPRGSIPCEALLWFFLGRALTSAELLLTPQPPASCCRRGRRLMAVVNSAGLLIAEPA